MAFPIWYPYARRCNIAEGATNSYHKWHPRVEEHVLGSILPRQQYSFSQVHNLSYFPENSSGLGPDCSLLNTALDSGLPGHYQAFNGATNVFRSSHHMLHPESQSFLPDELAGESDPFGQIAYLMPLDSTPLTFDSQSCSVPTQAFPIEPACPRSIDSAVILNNFPLPAEELFLAGDSALPNKSYPDYRQQESYVGLGMPDLETAVDCPKSLPMGNPQPPGVESHWLPMAALSYGSDEPFHSDTDFALIPHEEAVYFPVQAPQNRQPVGDASLNPVTRKRGSSHYSSRRIKAKMMQGCPKIIPKPAASSSGVIAAGIDGGQKETQGDKNVGGRKGPLEPQQRKKVSNVRALRACASCFISKASCSTGNICGNCSKKLKRDALEFPCCRNGLLDYSGAFLPAFLVDDLRQNAVAAFVKENVVFTEYHVMAQLSADPFCLSIELPIYETCTVNQSCSVKSDTNSHTLHILPYGIGISTDELMPSILGYIESLGNYSLWDAEKIDGDTPQMIWKILGAICKFHNANPMARENGLIRKAVHVFWMNYILGRSISFSEKSARRAFESLRKQSTLYPFDQYVSSPVLSRQLKGATYLLLEKYIMELLEGIEMASRKKTRTSWGICFCLNLVLCLLVEHQQIAIIEKISTKNGDPAQTREKHIEACEILEDLPLKYSWTLFKGIQGNYNPVADGCPKDNNSGQNQGEMELIGRIRQILFESRNEIRKLAGIVGSRDFYSDPSSFRTRASGRQVAKFLTKFCCLAAPPKIRSVRSFVD